MGNILECKICGGNIIPNSDGITGKCESCDATAVIPKETTNSSKINRANYLRRANDFEKALSLFEEIVKENPDDSEAYWGLVLCKFGIEYVDDVDGSKKPTCHRTMYNSILEDADYKAALENSVGAVRYLYEEEAERIDEIQKRIKSIAANEKPCDIFICYKESDDFGERTHDSVDVQEIYQRLEKKGFKVFFARKTLQNKLGEEYEPIVFAALNSAKIMLVYGSQPDYFTGVWVKNEWSRFRRMLKEHPEKKIIPIFDGSKMSAYDLPNELADFQAFDKYKVGFIEDLIEGLEKIFKEKSEEAETKKTAAVNNSAADSTNNLLKRSFLFLEDKNWKKADEYLEKVLDTDMENARAYLGKLMAELKIPKTDEIQNCGRDLYKYENFNKAVRFADDKFKKELIDYALTLKYNRALSTLNSSKNAADYENAEELFRELGDFKDSKEKINQCKKNIYTIASKYYYTISDLENAKYVEELFNNLGNFKDSEEKKNQCIPKAKEYMYNNILERKKGSSSKKDFYDLINAFKELGDYKDSLQQIEECNNAVINLTQKERAKKKIFYTLFASAGLIIIGIIVYFAIKNPLDYNKGIELMEEKNYDEAVEVFAKLEGYEDSEDKLLLSKYNKAIELIENKNYDEAIEVFAELDTYKDSKKKLSEVMSNYFFQKCDTISAGVNHIVGLKKDGTVVAVGDNDYGQCDVSDWTDIVSVAAGDMHTVGLKKDGTVVAVGYNFNYQCNVSNWTDIIAVSAGISHTVGLKSNGTVIAIGDNTDGRCDDVSDWTDIVSVAAERYHTVGLKSDGTVVAVGHNADGQCDVSDWSNIVSVAAGRYHTVGLKSDSTVVAVGYNADGQCDVSDWSNIVSVATEWSHTVGLKSDGTVVAVGDNSNGQCDVSDWTDIVSVYVGESYTIGLKSDGTVVTAGSPYEKIDISDWERIKG